LPTPSIAFPTETPAGTVLGTSKSGHTRSQKLANALKSCRRGPRKQRARCERLARRRYGKRGRH
jgi:hypothetical protein